MADTVMAVDAPPSDKVKSPVTNKCISDNNIAVKWENVLW